MFLLALLICYLSLLHFALAGRIPIRYKITGKKTECIYDQFQAREIVTYSVFVIEALHNGKQKASVAFEGPVAGNKGLLTPWQRNQQEDEESQKQNNEDGSLPAGQLGRMTTGREIRTGLISHWPLIKGPNKPQEVFERNFKVDWTYAGESEDLARARGSLLEKAHEEMRTYNLEHKDKGEDAPPLPLHTVVQIRVEPFEETHEITAWGWYRLCVSSDDFHPLIVEMDMRTAERMRGVNPGTGHVYTYEQREYLDEQTSMFGEGGKAVSDAEDGHNAAEDGDFNESKIKLKYMHELTSEIMKTQHDRMNRIRAHSNDAQRGAAEMKWSSKLETFMYVVITGVQVYTMHKWLLGNLLGK
eukprot:CAMPEP_0181089186 /NCGR_PEP_ID=MMETSP1071-20121207/7170_1 /TAXON_ID=35127 /ORGANISM="Thalassiosira sp., Strain NH16" /LENGTH=357 /DNA_ID=CAMNT_0023171121 /DNA_START=1 /DNA_END=1074 /DNA_ORIENTATION=+